MLRRPPPAAVIAAVAVFLTAASATVLRLERMFPAEELEVVRVRDRNRHMRMLQGSASVAGVVDFGVQGSSDPYGGVGLYFTRVKLGTPPREYNVQIDTGSDLLWVNCNSCSDCPRISGLGIDLSFYDTTSSSTGNLLSCSDPLCSSSAQSTSSQCLLETNQCGYSLHYGDGSGTSGFYVSDMMYFDVILGNSMVANSSAEVVFGCSTYQSGGLTGSVHALDGIFGFGLQGLSVVSQLSSRRVTPKAFSHCLKGGEKGGGILVLGEILDPNIVYTPLLPSQPHYNLNLQSIAINGQLLPIDQGVFATSNNQGTIVDSGTTLAYLVEEAYDPLVSGITGAVSQSAKPMALKESQCYIVTTSVGDIFPLVSLNFEGGASLVLRPEEYLVPSGYVDGGALWCIGFQRDPKVTILGDLVLKDKIVVYDLARQRIGWANYDCSLSVNVSVSFGRDEFVNAGQLHTSSSTKNTIFRDRVTHILLSISFLIFLWLTCQE